MKSILSSVNFYMGLSIVMKVYLVRLLLVSDQNPLTAVFYEVPFLILLFIFIHILFRSWTFIGMLILNLVLSFVFVAMTLYESYFDTIPSYYDLNQLSQAGSVADTADVLFRPVYLLFFADILVGLLLIVFKRKKIKSNERLSLKIMAVISVVMLVIAGGLFIKNLNEPFNESGLYARENGLIQSQFLQFYHRASAETQGDAYSAEELASLKGNQFIPYKDHQLFGAAEDRHLIVLQVESLQNFVIDLEVGGEEITPFLNQLIKESLYFDQVYQQIGAGNTSDAEVLFNMSVYPAGLEPTVNSIKASDELPSLPRLLREYGYHSATYHADDVTYWNRNNLYPAIGYDEYYEEAYYGQEDVVGLGPSDGYFLEKTLEAFDDILQTEEKMYANVMTMTSHTPFEMPTELEYLNLPMEYEGTLIGNYLQSVKYVDDEIERFVNDLKDRGVWENSLLVVFGDHSGVHGSLLTSEDEALLKEQLGKEYTLADRFNIPLIITAPGAVTSETISHTGGQIDMMPTVLNLLGISPDEMTIFGHNLYEYENNLLGMRYYLPNGSFINNDVMFSEESAKRGRKMWELDSDKEYSPGEINTQLQNEYTDHQRKVIDLIDASDYYLNEILSIEEAD